MRHRAPPALLALAVALAPAAGRAVDWPDAPVETAPVTQALAPFRWGRAPVWVATGSLTLTARVALTQVTAMSPSAEREAARAVLLRLLGDEVESARALSRARARDPHVDDDFDVALTAAWLDARAGQWTDAADRLDALVVEMPSAASGQDSLAFEAARWRMAAGPESVAAVVRALEARLLLLGPTPALRVTLALALARAGRRPEADALLRERAFLEGAAIAAARPPHGSPVATDANAAFGLWLLAHDRRPDARVQLEIAAREGVAAWRPTHERWLAEATVTPPRPRPGAVGAVVSRPMRDEPDE
ncbi:MAG: hypothetical protein R3A52_02140 [Polyangiales bacterium]